MTTTASQTTITFITGNANKLHEVVQILGSATKFSFTSCQLDLGEVQGDLDEISRHKVIEASRQIDGPVLVEDTALCFDALGSLPGPYIKWFLRRIKLEDFHRMLTGFDNFKAEAVCTFAYLPHRSDSPDDVLLFQGRTPGTIVLPRGSRQFGWDPIFQPDHSSNQTYAEMDKEVKNRISHRFKALSAFKEYLEKQCC